MTTGVVEIASVCLAGWLSVWLADCVTDWLASWLAICSGWLSGWLTGWLTGWLAVWLASCYPSALIRAPPVVHPPSVRLSTFIPPSIRSFVYPSVRPSVRPSVQYSSILLSFRPTFRPSIHRPSPVDLSVISSHCPFPCPAGLRLSPRTVLQSEERVCRGQRVGGARPLPWAATGVGRSEVSGERAAEYVYLTRRQWMQMRCAAAAAGVGRPAENER